MTDLLHVGNIGVEINSQQLHEIFAQAGRVISARVMTDSRTLAPRGFALVEMATPEDSRLALNAVNGQQLNGRVLTVRLLPGRAAAGWEGGNDRGGSNRSHGFGMGNGGSRW